MNTNWISISLDNLNSSDLFSACLFLYKNPNILNNTSGCTGTCTGGGCRF